jgi:hypothetical protein
VSAKYGGRKFSPSSSCIDGSPIIRGGDRVVPPPREPRSENDPTPGGLRSERSKPPGTPPSDALPDLDTVLGAHQRRAARASAYANDMLAAAASACADSLVLRLPAPSRESAHRSYERQLRREFQASYERLSRAWAEPEAE